MTPLPLDLEWRCAAPADVPRMLEIQRACYGEAFLESGALLLRRLAAAPGTSWVALRAGRVQAYLAAYPSRLGRLTPLHGEFEPAAAPDTLYLHDLAVHPEAAGAGLGPRLVARALEQARRDGLRHSGLVSVQASHAFWQRQGYADHALAQARQRQRLASYPGAARYMARALAG
ncbi:GNAT family N-acetyltransferase [Variovorax terrae]|uniref:GNAT family N-acetyltransferase n=1 Tax=Variovorax terrae TaxID=2923278 RepID=A0A9X1W4T0_9BURK|nr:GNAT family N-acetyltransferase [Variovorax terrae]MCJ0765743.1 GNAT family N-acetyltransferase [Variovorax terrae]